MQVFNADIAKVLAIMISSWLVAIVFNYLLISTLLKRWKPWEEMNEKEQASIFGWFSLGGFLGVIVWWILGSGALTNVPVLGLFAFPFLITWIVILMFAAALGGAIVVRRSSSDSNQ